MLGPHRFQHLARSVHFGFLIVPQQTAVIVERLGKFRTILSPGFHFMIPVLDKDAYYHSLKEEVYPVNTQMAITKDNVTIHIDGVLYLKIDDPYRASYGVGNPVEAMRQLAQTTMRSELGKLTLDKTFEEREVLNHDIVKTINEASKEWGIRCMRYEIRDITPPANIRKAMELQAEAERQKRAEILASEGRRAADINTAEGQRQSTILKAEGEAKAIVAKATATSEGVRVLAKGIQEESGGMNAVQLKLAEQYIDAFALLAKKNNTMIVPLQPTNVAGMLSTAMGIYKHMKDEPSTQKQVKPQYSDPILESTEDEKTSS